LRFFSDRRVQVSFVDLARKSIAPTELKRFAQRFGSVALLDPESPPYRDAGLGYLAMDDAAAFDRLTANPRLLRLPLVRAGTDVTVGVDEDAWRGWIAAEEKN
jgi:arsenate reductase-like glutaredoxin family protein